MITAARVERLSVNDLEVLNPKNEVIIEAKTLSITATEAIQVSSNQSAKNSHDLPIEELYLEVAHDLAQLAESKHRFEEIVDALERNLPPLPAQASAIELGSVISEELEVGLIDEIKKSKKQIKPEGPKQKEQIEIIDQFIKAQPTISKPKPISEPPDLTEKTDGFTGNIVSETLVEILLKQGKTEKAIEMLKKLIWKFPQKKAYFAAQIEGLKK
jgi:tetratricopeptide (TPR) repeat protein